MNEWDANSKELAHIGLCNDKKHFNFQMWNRWIKPYLKADDKIVLDYGCGGGLFFEWLIDNYNPTFYIALDVSERSLKECERVVRSHNKQWSCSFYKIPDEMTKSKPNIIVCNAVIQHMTLGQFNKFRQFCDHSGANDLFIQIRWSDELVYNPNVLIKRLSLDGIDFNNYELIHSSDVLKNGYKFLHYELLRNHTS